MYVTYQLGWNSQKLLMDLQILTSPRAEKNYKVRFLVLHEATTPVGGNLNSWLKIATSHAETETDTAY